MQAPPITPGLIFTGTPHAFKGRIEVITVDAAKKTLHVKLTQKHETHFSDWNEDWNLDHVIAGFEVGEYHQNYNFHGYPAPYFAVHTKN